MKLEPMDLSVIGPEGAEVGSGDLVIEGDNSRFLFDGRTLETHLLFLGSTGSGKTNAIFQFVRIIKDKLMTKDDVMVIFDTKGDYSEEFYDATRGDILISSQSLDQPSQDAIWNVFEDLKADSPSEWEQNSHEIARTIFDEKIRTAKDPFFPEAASDIFKVVMLALLMDAANSKDQPTNADLRKTLGVSTPADINTLLKRHPDLLGPIEYISLPTGQTQGVMSEVQSTMSDIFHGAFAQPGKFSVRRFVREKGGRTLFIEYDLRWGRVLTPVYRLLIDLAIKESLGRAKGKGNVFFVIDEFALLPNLRHVDDGINFGRGQGVKFLVGTQNVSQVLEAYGGGRGKSILSNFGTLLAFRLNDQESRDLVAARYGNYQVTVRLPSPIPNEPLSSQIVEAKVISDLAVSLLENGRCIICSTGVAPQIFRFALYKAAKTMELPERRT